MSTNKHLNHIAAILMLITVIYVTVFSFYPSLIGIKAAENTIGYEKYFDEDSVMTVDIIADDGDWETMLDNAQSEEYIKCDVVINGERINNVGIRPKGNSSLQQVASSGSDRYSLKIEFDHYVKNQTFHGLDKLVLNNTQADATYMKEFMSYEIFESVGVAAPLHSYAQIELNGENKGLYLAIEAMEESYATRVYGADYGELYRPESVNVGGGFGAKAGSDLLVDFKNDMFQDTNNTNSTKDTNDTNGNKTNTSNSTDTTSGATQKSDQETQNAFPGNMDIGKGMLGSSSGGTDLVYTDDEVSSYSAVYDSAVFDATEDDFKRVIKALKNLNSGTDLEKYINVDATLRYFAAQTFIINFDSYYGSLKHNYYLYEKDGQLTMLPWDLNLAFAGYESKDASTAINNPIDTPVSGVDMSERPMLSKLLEVPEYKKLYHKYLNEIVTDYIDNGKFSEKISKTNDLIRSYVENDATAFYTIEEYEDAVPVLEKFGLLRAQSIAGQLNGTIPSTTDGQSENSAALVDVSDLDLSAMGSQGGDGAGGKGTINGNMGGGRRMMGRPGASNSSGSDTGDTSTGDTSADYNTGQMQGGPSNFGGGGYGGQMQGSPGKFGDGGQMPDASSNFGNDGYLANVPGNGGNSNIQQPGASDNKAKSKPSTTGTAADNPSEKITKTDLLSFGVLGGVAVLGLLFACLYQRKKYKI